MITLHRTHILGIALFSVVMLSGCLSWPWKKSVQTASEQGTNIANEEVLLSIDGKPVLTVEDYENQLKEAAASSPQLEMMLQMTPDAEYEFIFNNLKMTKLISHWAHATGITESAEFKKDRAHLQELLDTQLCVQYYDQAHPIDVSDADIKAFYDAEKDKLPGLLLAPGGVKTEAVKFESQAAAQTFLDVVKAQGNNLDKIAKDQKLSVNNFVINESTFHSKPLKDFALQASSYPVLGLVKADDAYWVAKVVEKTAAKYQDFEKVKEGLRNFVRQQRKDENMRKAAEQFEKEYQTIENKAYFDNKVQARKTAMDQMQQKIQAQLQSENAREINQEQQTGLPNSSSQVV